MLHNLGYIYRRSVNIPVNGSLNIIRRSLSSADTDQPVVGGIFKSVELKGKSYIKLYGPDSIKFLNGLVTSKLEETFVKKNLTTISDKSHSPNGKPTMNDEHLLNFDTKKGNWGLYNELSQNGSYISRFGQYTGFLEGKGKLITDSIIYPTPLILESVHSEKFPSYLIEVNKQNMFERMLHILQGHKLLSKVKIDKVKEKNIKTWDILIQFTNIPKESENPWIDNIICPMSSMKTPDDALNFTNTVIGTLFNGHEKSILSMYIENRVYDVINSDGSVPILFRILTDDSVNDISDIFNQEAFPFKFDISTVRSSYFRKWRLEYGLTDGPVDVIPNTALPLELNFDFYPNVVSSNKGCYVGQELTARTFSTGILRKRLVPVKLTNYEILSGFLKKDQDPEAISKLIVQISPNEEDTIADQESSLAPNPFGSTKSIKKRKRPVGKLVASEGDVGVIMLRTEYFDRLFNENNDLNIRPKLFIEIESAGSNSVVGVEPSLPFWYMKWLESNKPSQ